MKRHFGFSVVELTLAIALLAILLSLGAPGLTEIVAKNRIAAQANSFVATLNVARSEAVKRGVNVYVCKVGKISGGDAPNFDRCDKAGDWSNGWIVFYDDPDRRFDKDASVFAPTETSTLNTVIAKHEGLDGSSLTGNGSDTVGSAYYLAYNGMGMIYPMPPSELGSKYALTLSPRAIGDGDGKEKGRCININMVGRVEVVKIASGSSPPYCS